VCREKPFKGVGAKQKKRFGPFYNPKSAKTSQSVLEKVQREQGTQAIHHPDPIQESRIREVGHQVSLRQSNGTQELAKISSQALGPLPNFLITL